jgi:hypothetical protein
MDGNKKTGQKQGGLSATIGPPKLAPNVVSMAAYSGLLGHF